MIAYNINTPRESLIRKEPLTGEKHIRGKAYFVHNE
jgi:hypothetical protein